MRTNGSACPTREADYACVLGQQVIRVRSATCWRSALEGSDHGGLPGLVGLTYYKCNGEVNLDTSTR